VGAHLIAGFADYMAVDDFLGLRHFGVRLAPDFSPSITLGKFLSGQLKDDELA